MGWGEYDKGGWLQPGVTTLAHRDPNWKEPIVQAKRSRRYIQNRYDDEPDPGSIPLENEWPDWLTFRWWRQKLGGTDA